MPPLTDAAGATLALGTHRWEQYHVPDVPLVRQEHDEPVEPYPETSGRRHPVLQGPDEVLVLQPGQIVAESFDENIIKEK